MTYNKEQASSLGAASDYFLGDRNFLQKHEENKPQCANEINKLDATEPSLLQSLISGAFGGTLMVVVGHPFDLVKVRQQTLYTANAPKINRGIMTSGLRSMYADLKTIVNTQGARELYRGLMTPLFAVAPTFAVEYGAFEFFQSAIRNYSLEPTDQTLNIWQVAVAGGLSAIPATFLVAPAERIKCLIQVSTESEKSKHGSLRQAWRNAGGIKGLYTGTLATLIRDSPGTAAYFATYHSVKRGLSSDGASLSPFAIMFAGGLAGMANWTVAIPADVIKSCQQTTTVSQARLSFIATLRSLIQTEGVPGLFRGLTPALIRAFPANAACFLGIESSLALMGINSSTH